MDDCKLSRSATENVRWRRPAAAAWAWAWYGGAATGRACLAGQAGRPQEACFRRQAQAAAATLAQVVFLVQAVRLGQAQCRAMVVAAWEEGQGNSARRPWGAGMAALLRQAVATAALQVVSLVELAQAVQVHLVVSVVAGEGGAWTWRGLPGRQAALRRVQAMAVQLVGCEHRGSQ